MKQIMVLSLCTFVVLTGCASTNDPARNTENAVEHTITPESKSALASKQPLAGKQATLFVNGLGCPQCATNADRQLARTRGVLSYEVDLGQGTIRIEMLGTGNPSPYELREAMADAAFTLVRITTP
jgi:copper chaperone CopZ